MPHRIYGGVLLAEASATPYQWWAIQDLNLGPRHYQ